MENKTTGPAEPDVPDAGGFGPLPALPEAPPAALSGARRTVLETLRSYAAPVTLAELGEATALHANTLREHLDGLEAEGRVRRRRAEPSGRGRPAWLYEAVVGTSNRRAMEHAGLATALAAAIHRTSPDPWADAVEAGIGWGRELVGAPSGEVGGVPVSQGVGVAEGADGAGGAEGDSGPAARAAAGGEAEGGAAAGGGAAGGASEADRAARGRVVDLLDDLGFAPEPDATVSEVRLTRCPLLDAARRYPDVVCGVHLGIVRGALETWGRPAEGVELRAFAEPGACLLHLPSPPSPSSAPLAGAAS